MPDEGSETDPVEFNVENDPVTDFPSLDITGDFDIDPWTQQVTTPGQRGTGWCAPSP